MSSPPLVLDSINLSVMSHLVSPSKTVIGVASFKDVLPYHVSYQIEVSNMIRKKGESDK